MGFGNDEQTCTCLFPSSQCTLDEEAARAIAEKRMNRKQARALAINIT